MKLATFNLYQYATPPYYWYEEKQGNSYSDTAWQVKTAWIKDQLRLMDADVVGFQEVFSVDSLEELVHEVGYNHFHTVEQPALDADTENVFVKPVVAIASRFPLRDVQAVQVSDEIRADLPVEEGFNFSRHPLRAYVNTPDLGNVLVYVAHLKSKRPMVDQGGYEESTSWKVKVQDSLKRLSRGHVASLLQRGAEATALYHDVSKILNFDENQPVVVLGDLNDDENSIPISALSMQDNIYEIDEVGFHDLPGYVKGMVFDFKLKDAFNDSPDTTGKARPFTHIYRGHGGVLDYILVSNALNSKNHDRVGQLQSFEVFNSHLGSDGVGNKRQSDHGQVLISLAPKNGQPEPPPGGGQEPEEPSTLTRQEFIDIAGGIYQSADGYRDWSGQDKWENFWQFFFETDNGWVKSIYGSIPVDELYQKRRHSIEHIIPKSFLKDYLRRAQVADNVRKGATVNPFNFAACERGLNSGRSNFPFDMEDDEIKRPFRIVLNPDAYMTTGLDAEHEWVIPSRTRGDIARTILYMVLVYEIDELYNRHLNTLVHWARIDPPTTWEIAFNQWVEAKMGINNPFIAEPEISQRYLNDTSLLKSVLVEGEG